MKSRLDTQRARTTRPRQGGRGDTPRHAGSRRTRPQVAPRVFSRCRAVGLGARRNTRGSPGNQGSAADPGPGGLEADGGCARPFPGVTSLQRTAQRSAQAPGPSASCLPSPVSNSPSAGAAHDCPLSPRLPAGPAPGQGPTGQAGGSTAHSPRLARPGRSSPSPVRLSVLFHTP